MWKTQKEAVLQGRAEKLLDRIFVEMIRLNMVGQRNRLDPQPTTEPLKTGIRSSSPRFVTVEQKECLFEIISRKVSAHVLRHTFAVTAILKGLSLPSLQRLLGHDRLTTTEIYLNISPEEVIKEFQSKW